MYPTKIGKKAIATPQNQAIGVSPHALHCNNSECYNKKLTQKQPENKLITSVGKKTGTRQLGYVIHFL